MPKHVILGILTAGQNCLTEQTNSRSVARLLMGFFDYYSRFDYANRAISIAHGCCVERYSCIRDMGNILVALGNAYRG